LNEVDDKVNADDGVTDTATKATPASAPRDKVVKRLVFINALHAFQPAGGEHDQDERNLNRPTTKLAVVARR
jgi:hypothetical protein